MTQDKPLIDRMKEDITTCLSTGKHRKFGRDRDGNRKCYCTYFFPNGQFQPYDRGMRCEEMYEIKTGEGIGEQYICYFRCKDLTSKGKKK